MPVTLYLVWWLDDDTNNTERLIDASVSTGVIDLFIVEGFIKTGITGPFSSNGRYINDLSTDPWPTGKVNITIETNQ